MGGSDVDSTVTALDFCEVKFDQAVMGDDVQLLHFACKIRMVGTDITGLVKLEAFEYDSSNPDTNQAMTTVKTFSITWAGR